MAKEHPLQHPHRVPQHPSSQGSSGLLRSSIAANSSGQKRICDFPGPCRKRQKPSTSWLRCAVNIRAGCAKKEKKKRAGWVLVQEQERAGDVLCLPRLFCVHSYLPESMGVSRGGFFLTAHFTHWQSSYQRSLVPPFSAPCIACIVAAVLSFCHALGPFPSLRSLAPFLTCLYRVQVHLDKTALPTIEA